MECTDDSKFLWYNYFSHKINSSNQKKQKLYIMYYSKNEANEKMKASMSMLFLKLTLISYLTIRPFEMLQSLVVCSSSSSYLYW